MTDRPSSDDRDAPRPEVSAFLHDRATSLDREAAPVTADEAARHTIVDASAPRRQWPAALRPSKVRANPRSALAAAAVIALIVGALGGFAIGRGSAPKHSTWRPRLRARRRTSPTPPRPPLSGRANVHCRRDGWLRSRWSGHDRGCSIARRLKASRSTGSRRIKAR